jgi:hypothetical protein
MAADSPLQELSVGILNCVRDVTWSFTEKRQRVFAGSIRTSSSLI